MTNYLKKQILERKAIDSTHVRHEMGRQEEDVKALTSIVKPTWAFLFQIILVDSPGGTISQFLTTHCTKARHA